MYALFREPALPYPRGLRRRYSSPMELYPMADPGPSPDAIALYHALRRYGGSLRMATLRKRFAPEGRPALAAAIDELAERYWIRVIHLKNSAALSNASCPLDGIDRLCTSRFGRSRGPKPPSPTYWR